MPTSGERNPIYKDKFNKFAVRAVDPDQNRIATSHVERANLTLRTWNRRFNRKTICFSKSLDYLEMSVYLFAVHYNFCRPHGSLARKTTPTVASGLAENPLSLEGLVSRYE